MNLEKKKSFLLNSLYFLVCILIIYLIFRVAIVYLFPFIIGIIIAYIVQKPAFFLESKIKIKKENCAAILSVIFYCFTIVLFALLIWFFYNFCNNLMQTFAHNGDIISSIESKFENIFNKINSDSVKKILSDTVSDLLTRLGNLLTSAVTAFIRRIPALVFTSVITIVSSCYIAKDFEKLKRFIKGFVSENICNKFTNIKNSFLDCFFKFTLGYFWLYLITFIELFVAFLILKVKNALVLALIISFVDLLPVFGTGMVLLPWSIFSFLYGNYKLGFGLAILYVMIFIIRNFLEPKIIGKQININPIFTLLFIFLGLKIGGIAGLLIFPLVLTGVFNYYRRQYYDIK